jgi:hypothetical protein
MLLFTDHVTSDFFYASCPPFLKVHSHLTFEEEKLQLILKYSLSISTQPSGSIKSLSERMCGIVAYIGQQEAAPLLIEGLQRLEYRGYDSAGIAVIDNNSGVNVQSEQQASQKQCQANTRVQQVKECFA